MKHVHYDKVVAKAANMDLVVFVKWDDWGWKELPCNDGTISFSSSNEYFPCLPQHKKACLHWLNTTADKIAWVDDCEFMKVKSDDDTAAGFRHLTNNCGEVEIVQYTNARSVLVEFVDTGYRVTTQMDSVRKGKIKDPYALTVYGVGFVGEGEKTRDKNGHTKCYQTWHSMMSRCYNKDHKQYHNYGGRGVCVHESWHNFQNFAKWFDENYEKGKELDKDKLSGKSHGDIYSDVWCCFVTPQENTAISQSREYSICNPKGEELLFSNMRAFCRINNLDRSAILRVIKGESSHHKGWTRIKPKKEKRWIAVDPSTTQCTRHYSTKESCFNSEFSGCDGNSSGWQFIEIEVEV